MSRSPRQPPAREAVARLPSRARSRELLPSSRSLALGVAAAVVAVLAFAAARETSLFAVRTIEVRGVDPKLARRVETALGPLQGVSLLKVHSGQIERLATSLPSVASVTYDRAFPNTLRVVVDAEEPAAVVRHGARAWLVSRRGRLMEPIAQRTHRGLPRIWLAQALGIPVGATLAPGAGAEEVALIDELRGQSLARLVRSVRQVNGQWTYVLRGGVQIRVGDRTDVPVKLAVAAAILRRTPIFGYLDVSVPQRPVAHENSQVSG